MKTSCDSVEEKLVAYIDNELSPSDKKAVKQHLDSCDRCQNFFGELDAANDLVMSVADSADLPVDFDKMWENIEAQVDFSTALSGRLSGRWKRFIERFRKPIVWIPSAVATAVVASLIIFLPVHIGHKPVMVSQVEEVSPGTGQVFVLKTAASGQPLIWYQPGNATEKEAG